jgi:hypothetical protein
MSALAPEMSLHPEAATVYVGRQAFECDEERDWQQSIQLASIPLDGTGHVAIKVAGRILTQKQTTLFVVAAKRFAAMVTCYSCRDRKLDPDDIDSVSVELCPTCYEESGVENEHSDGYHDGVPPVAGCPVCRELGPSPVVCPHGVDLAHQACPACDTALLAAL